jgi:tetratricopeptide (TPR) repeat protein
MSSKPSILTRGQKRLLWVLMAASAYMVANAAYLHLCPPQKSVLGAFYQWMLVTHVVVGAVLLLPMIVFVLWHLPRAIRMHNLRAILSGLVVTVAALALFVTGLFIFSKANSIENRWAFLSHQVLAVLAPVGYAAHRLVAHFRPSWKAVGKAALVPVGCLAVMLGAHFATMPPAPPGAQAMVAKPADGVDPFKDSFPEYGTSGAEPGSVFHPANTRTITGALLPERLLTNADLPAQAELAADVAKYGFAVNARIGSETCARCHQDVVEQWARSAHRFASFNNPFYRVSVEAIRKEEDGRHRSQWCAGCHDPAIMMAGNMTKDIQPLIPESQAGLTCLACHAIDEIHGVGGNGGYRIADAEPEPYLFAQAKSGPLAEVHDLLIRSKPDVHKRNMLKPVFRTAEFCAVCHKVSLDVPVNNYRWVRGQNDYDSHHDSGITRNNARTFYLPPEPRRCQDCHMPLVDAPLGDLAAKGGKVRSHQFFGPNTALPTIRGDHETVQALERFLQKGPMGKAPLRVDVFAIKRGDGSYAAAPDLREIALQAGDSVEVQVVIRNQDVGHSFPAGTLDSNEAWVHFRAADAKTGELLYESGAVDEKTLDVDQHAHFYRALFVNERSEEADKRNPQHFRGLVHLKVIGPGTADVVRYRLEVPEAWAGRTLAATATLRWRKFTQNYVEFTWKTLFPDRPLPVLPITDLGTSTAKFPVVAGAPPAPAALPPAAGEQWVRFNDWGIGFLVQGDTVAAAHAFRVLTEIQPDRVDGWRNLARTALDPSDGDPAVAIGFLQEASKRDPGNAQTAYFFGMAREKTGQLDDAILAFERAREDFPQDRTIHLRLGQLRYRLGRYDEALTDFLRVLAIDPEDRAAHNGRLQVYLAKGDDKAAAEAKKAFLKYSIDESAQKWTNEYRRKNPHVNLESNPIHTHGAPERGE